MGPKGEQNSSREMPRNFPTTEKTFPRREWSGGIWAREHRGDIIRKRSPRQTKNIKKEFRSTQATKKKGEFDFFSRGKNVASHGKRVKGVILGDNGNWAHGRSAGKGENGKRLFFILRYETQQS